MGGEEERIEEALLARGGVKGGSYSRAIMGGEQAG
jgi:hypothetical protein